MKTFFAYIPLLGMSFCLGITAWALTGLLGLVVTELWFFALSIIIHDQRGTPKDPPAKPQPFPSLLSGNNLFQRKHLRQG